MTAMAVLAFGLAVWPQSVPPAAPPTPAPQAVPVQETVVTPAAQAAADRASARHRRDEMGVMEGVLTAAVRLGAEGAGRAHPVRTIKPSVP